MARTIDARTLRAWLNDGLEIALLDISDGGPYSRGHILVATGVPLTNFETHIVRLLPRRSVRIVLTDGDGSGLERAADILETFGFADVHALEDGNNGWARAGFHLFSGSNIVSKAFGEIVEQRLGTPHVDAPTLRSWIAEGRQFALFDVRPLAEYRTVSIPGATNCPGMETVFRLPALLDDPNLPVVVNCAGRTRSIIGAQSLRDFGLPNPVFALENGTMGWQLHGFEPDNGQSNLVAAPVGDDLATARSVARALGERHAISLIDKATLDDWLEDATRTTYVFDVRLADDFAFARFPGSVNAPGGQLIQSTDTFAAVRHARIVVIDEHEVQAIMAAHWLTRMGWNVAVLTEPLEHLCEHGPVTTATLSTPDDRAIPVDAAELRELHDAGSCSIIDVGESYWYRQGRIPGSYYAMRSRLAVALSDFDRARTLVFCCSAGNLAPFAAGDAVRLGFTDVRYLTGGRAAWRRVGGDYEVIGDADDGRLLTETDDMWYPPWARAEGAREAMQEYLTWEVGLIERLRGEEYLHFSKDFDLPH